MFIQIWASWIYEFETFGRVDSFIGSESTLGEGCLATVKATRR